MAKTSKQKGLMVNEFEKLMALWPITDKIDLIESYGKRLRKKNSAQTEEEVAQFAKKMTGKRIIDY